MDFWYEYHDGQGRWWRAYGIEHWTFDKQGLMERRDMSGNDVGIEEGERWFDADGWEGVDLEAVRGRDWEGGGEDGGRGVDGVGEGVGG